MEDVTKSELENTPVKVLEGAIPTGEVRARWAWTEPTVWTERMLTTLEQGVGGGKWHALIDKVYSERNLKASFDRVRRKGKSAGVDHETAEHFARNTEENLDILMRRLRDNQYHPGAVRRVEISKPGSREKRPLGIPTIRDRTVQTALYNVIAPIFEVGFAEHSYGFRPELGCKDALRRVTELLKKGYVYVVDADIRSFFDMLNHEMMMMRIGKKISDSRTLSLIESHLKQNVMQETSSWTPEEGAPQGAVLSPLLSNIYLDPLDHLLKKAGFELVRYADGWVVLCRTREEAERAMDKAAKWLRHNGLNLHPEKTRLVDASQYGGFDFLGYHFERGYKWASKKSIGKLRDTIRGKSKRTNGHSMECIIANINKTLKGWFEYFKHSHRTTLPRLDKWIRMRLRSILRKRRKRKGRGRGKDHPLWPNAWFTDLGLFSLMAAQESVSQSSRR